MDLLEPFGRQRLKLVLAADTIDPVPGDLFFTLIDEQAVVVQRFRRGPVSSDIGLHQVGALLLQYDLPEPVALAPK